MSVVYLIILAAFLIWCCVADTIDNDDDNFPQGGRYA